MKKKDTTAPPLPALSLAGSTRLTYTFSRILFIIFIILAISVFFLPWRQNTIGNGKVIAFDPLERRLNVESQLSGRVKVLNVVEGQAVKKDEVIAEIEDNDPLLMENLKSQRETIKSREQFAESKLQQIESQEAQIELSKKNALLASQEDINAARAQLKTVSLEYDRTHTLYDEGLTSRREYEQVVMKKDTADADLKSAESLYEKTISDYDSSLSLVRSQKDSTRAEIESAKQEVVKLDSVINKTSRQVVKAPRDGIIYKVVVTDGTYLSPGQLICSIVPKTDSRYVEIWLDGNDIALIKARKEVDGESIPGSPVRLSFEGWPSIQAIGWPQLAVGTFGGEVVFIDSASDAGGDFRVVIGPSEDEIDRYNGEGKVKVGWPDKERWLRQGTLTQAWFLLEEVPLWMEIWRKMNGFPPLIRDENGNIDPTMKK